MTHFACENWKKENRISRVRNEIENYLVWHNDLYP